MSVRFVKQGQTRRLAKRLTVRRFGPSPPATPLLAANCCNPHGCDQAFGERFARKASARYRKRGLDHTAERMVGFLAQRGVAGATVLEIGGGVGEIEIELLSPASVRTKVG